MLFLGRTPTNSWARWVVLSPLAVLLTAALDEWFVDANAAECPGGTGTPSEPFCTIMDAVDAASAGDTIFIAPGTYPENLVLDKDLALIGTGGDRVTVVDGQRRDVVIRLENGTTTHIGGLTVTGGYTMDGQGGGGILLPGAGPTALTMTSSTIRGNASGSRYFGAAGGGLMNGDMGEVELVNTTVSDNLVGSFNSLGGGLYNRGVMRLKNCCLTGNQSSGPSERGSAIYNSGELVLDGCTVSNNSGLYNSARAIRTSFRGRTAVRSSIVWDNAAYGAVPVTGYNTTVDHSDVQAGWAGPGVGNLDVDPLFANTMGGDYSLLPTSPCIDAGDPLAPAGALARGGHPRLLDGDLDGGMRVDMGAFEFSNVTLAVTGSATPGGTLTFDTTGTAGLSVFLAIGRPPGRTLLAPWGTSFLNPAAPIRLFALGTLPSSIALTIPAEVSGRFAIQTLALVSSGGPPPPGNLSNPVFVDIE